MLATMLLRLLPLPLAIGFALLSCGGNVVLAGGTASTASSTAGAGGSPTMSGAGGGAGGSPVTMGSGGGGTGAGPFALVSTHADPNGPCFGGANPPNAVFVMVANRPITCAKPTPPDIAPYGSTNFSGFVWEVCFAVAPADLVPGTLTIDSVSPPWGMAYEADADGSTPCGGGGVLCDGTLTIASVQESSVTFSLSGTDFTSCNLSLTVSSDGTYTASRCP